MNFKLIKKTYKIFCMFSVLFSVFAMVLICFNLDSLFDIKECYYSKTTEYSDAPSLWRFNGIQVDDVGNIYVGHNHGIEVFDKEGKRVGGFSLNRSSDNFSFKIEDKNIRIISSISLDGQNSYSFTKTYETDFSQDVIYEEDTYVYDWDAVIIHDQSFASYKKENGFTKTKEVEQNGTTYKYLGFGKIKIGDGTTEKTLNLDTKVFPLPTRFAFYPAIICLFIAIGLKMVLKKKQKQEQLDE